MDSSRNQGGPVLESKSSICSLWGLSRVIQIEKDKQETQKITDFLDYFHLKSAWKTFKASLTIIEKSTARLGFEFEIENIKQHPLLPPLWQDHEDLSLRNNGIEFQSTPLPTSHIKIALFFLKIYLAKIAKQNPDFSWRTSTHIHSNAQSLSMEQLLFEIRLYLVFEPFIYDFVGGHRETSNFCVPLWTTNLDSALISAFLQAPTKEFITRLYQHWPKYAGLSLFRLFDLGTIEFRQFPGGSDYNKLSIWINIIISLYEAAINLNIEKTDVLIKELNTTSQYEEFFLLIMQNNVPLPENCKTLLSQGITFAKHCFSPLSAGVEFPCRRKPRPKSNTVESEY